MQGLGLDVSREYEVQENLVGYTNRVRFKYHIKMTVEEMSKGSISLTNLLYSLLKIENVH